MKSLSLFGAWLTISLFYGRIASAAVVTGEDATPIPTTEPFVALSNDLIDETLKWVKFKYLCGFDPLLLPPVNQDDLNISYSLTISDIGIQGLSHVLRLADVEIEKYDRGHPFKSLESPLKSGEDAASATGRYSIASTLGIRDVRIKFRVEVLKILSLSIVDFVANGSVPEIDIPMLALVTPSEKSLQFDRISIENLDQLTVDIKGQNFLTFIGGSIPSVKNYITTLIKDAIRENLKSRIGTAKDYLNGLLTSVTSFQATTDSCPSLSSPGGNNGSGDGNQTVGSGTRLPPDPIPPPRPQFLLTTTDEHLPGLPNAFGLIVKYRSRVIGSIPLPGDNRLDPNETAGMLFGYFDLERNEFVLNKNGVVHRHKNDKKDGPNWPLTSAREENSLSLYAQDDSSLRKIKLNPFIVKATADV